MKFLFGLACISLFWIMLGTTSISFSQLKKEVKVNSSRPLAAAILALEAQMKIPISYEDPPYRYNGDVAISPEGPLIPKPGGIEFVYSDQIEGNEIIRSLVEANSKQGNPGIFGVKVTEGFYQVVPLKYKSEKGELVEHKSILETNISMSFQNLTSFDIIGAICKEVSNKLNIKVVTGMIPLAPFSAAQKTLTFVDRPADECLIELIKKTDYNLSWQLFYDPKLRWYVLNIHPVGYTSKVAQ